MPKNVAVFDKLTMQELIAKARVAGYDATNPDSKLVHGFPAGGGFSAFREDELDRFLEEGNGILLWKRGTTECVYACLMSGKPHISFGGLSDAEQTTLTRALRGHARQDRPRNKQ